MWSAASRSRSLLTSRITNQFTGASPDLTSRSLLPGVLEELQNGMAGLNVTEEARRYRSNRSRRGLYNGKDVRFGNKLSFSMKSSRRKFKPNVFIKTVFSETLGEKIRFHLTASTLRSIDQAGGLDNYLLTSKHVTEGEGLVAKKRILAARKHQQWKARKEEREKEREEEKLSAAATE